MPAYDFRCKACGTAFTLHYRSISAYDTATPACTACGATDLSRLITSVNISRGNTAHNFREMSSTEMLSVLESGDSRAVGEMMKQVGGGAPTNQLGEDYHNAAEALSRGVDMGTVERDLGAGALGDSATEPPQTKQDDAN